MPEAVASNSTPAPEGASIPERIRRRPKGIPALSEQFYFQKLPPYVEENYEAVVNMIKAHGVMVQAVMENGDDFSLYADGIHQIYRLILMRLDAVVETVDHYIDKMAGRELAQGESYGDLMERVGQIVAAAYTEAGVEMDLEQQLEWSKDRSDTYFKTTAHYLRELNAKMEGGDNHLLTAGSLLPWLELKIWREVAGIDLAERDSVAGDASLRDRLLFQQAKAGVSPNDLSQAFGIKRAAVERIIARLTAREEESRKAV